MFDEVNTQLCVSSGVEKGLEDLNDFLENISNGTILRQLEDMVPVKEERDMIVDCIRIITQSMLKLSWK